MRQGLEFLIFLVWGPVVLVDSSVCEVRDVPSAVRSAWWAKRPRCQPLDLLYPGDVDFDWPSSTAIFHPVNVGKMLGNIFADAAAGAVSFSPPLLQALVEFCCFLCGGQAFFNCGGAYGAL